MPKPVSPSEFRPTAVPDVAEGTPFPRIPGYRFLKRLGQGGMATVYLATQESLDRPVSIKVMEREALQDEISMQRFENEARTIAKLTHPSIVNIYEVGRTADARMYYIMPYLPNGDLSQRDMRNDGGRIVDVLRSLLSALDYAHARGVVHRDVKEENVLFDVADRPMLTDFGIALSKRDKSRITTAGLAVGSSGYMAPEQARGDEVDGRADLYSVGVLAFELLTGRLPFRSPDALALALMHAQKPVPLLPPAKRHWQAFIDRAMAKSPDHRFRDAQQMSQALDRVGRRTGNHLVVRMLRRIDLTVDGELWKHPGTIALGGALLLAIGLYSARDRLPAFGASSVSLQPPPIAAPAATASEPGAVDPAAHLAMGPSMATAVPSAAAPAAIDPAPIDPAPATANATVSAQAVSTATTSAPTTSAPLAGALIAPAAAATPLAANPVPVRPSPVATPVPVKPAPVKQDLNTFTVVRAPEATPISPAPPVNVATKPTTPGAPSPGTSISPDAAVLGEARDALAHANLTSPADDNAVDLTRMAWKLSPATHDTQALANNVFKAISVQQGIAISQHHDQRVLDYQLKAQQLADATIGRATPAWRNLHSDAGSAIEKRVQEESDASDAAALKRTKALAKQLEVSDVYNKALAAAQQQALVVAQQKALAAAQLKASLVPPKPLPTGLAAGFVPVPAAPGAKDSVALARAEVTRGEYAQFANATHRAASACSEQRSAGQTATGKSWTDPGFDQGSEQPVVCVSWNDANAYAQWLSAKNGQRYRLAGTSDWRAMKAGGSAAGDAHVGGSFSEWLQNCSFLCMRHLVAGRAWREHGTDTPAGLATDRGFDDVGFRVVRVQDAQR